MCRTRLSGYTLIELMLVVAIIAIISSIAYPAYVDSTRTSKLEDAKSALTSLAKALERRYTQVVPNTYGGNATSGNDTGSPAATFFPDTAPLDSNLEYYDLAIDSATATGYTVSATAITGIDVNTDCTPLTYSSTGARGPAGCW